MLIRLAVDVDTDLMEVDQISSAHEVALTNGRIVELRVLDLSNQDDARAYAIALDVLEQDLTVRP